MHTIEKLLALAREDSTSVLFPPDGLPNLESGDVLPEDVEICYNLCGGGILLEDDYFPVPLAKPGAFVLANPKILIGFPPELVEAERNGITGSWYIVSEWNGTEYVCVDCHPLRLGRCYYSSAYTHAMIGQSPIIAMSFTEFLGRVLENRGGDDPYWDQPTFTSYGDAYDVF